MYDDDLNDPDFDEKSSESDSSESEEEEYEDVDGDEEQDHENSDELSECQPKVIIQKTNNTPGKRVFDKSHYCYYCGKRSTSIRRHYFGPHKSEAEVKKILNIPENSKERKLELLKLSNAGDLKHNTDVLKKGEGVLVINKRSSRETLVDDYVPCEICLGFFKRPGLSRHKTRCPLKEKSEKPSGYTSLWTAFMAINRTQRENTEGRCLVTAIFSGQGYLHDKIL